jgi:phosphoglycerate dehydrogenase-like enzyme
LITLTRPSSKRHLLAASCLLPWHAQGVESKMALNTILVLGLGKVGTLVGALLNKTGFQVVGAARSQRADLPFKTVTF